MHKTNPKKPQLQTLDNKAIGMCVSNYVTLQEDRMGVGWGAMVTHTTFLNKSCVSFP